MIILFLVECDSLEYFLTFSMCDYSFEIRVITIITIIINWVLIFGGGYKGRWWWGVKGSYSSVLRWGFYKNIKVVVRTPRETYEIYLIMLPR